MFGKSPFEHNPQLDSAIKKATRSAINAERSEESAEYFSEEAQDSFGTDERGSEDVVDMMSKGTI